MSQCPRSFLFTPELWRSPMPDLLNHLPIQPTPFIGREKEVAAVLHQLSREDVRLVTLTGPGGVGKTRIALHVVGQLHAHFAYGVWFVSLAPISDPDLVIPTILAGPVKAP